MTVKSQPESNLRQKLIAWPDTPVQLDTMVIAPSSLVLIAQDTLNYGDYRLSPDGQLEMYTPKKQEAIWVSYRVLPIPYLQVISRKDSSIIREQFEYEDPFAYKPSQSNGSRTIFGLEGFEKRGSISRGVQVGNAQDLSVSSDLNLQLSGKVTEHISLLANISDDNIPIQADGSTQQLQEFDQVFIKLYTDRSALVAGDYKIASGPGYFNTYLKKARGALFETKLQINKEDSLAQLGMRVGAAVSRGRFARNIIQGVEANQGPYKLRGANGELFVIVLSGTERIYIDGRLLKRGKEFDYTIDYNAAEIVFTANQLITKDKRIVAEFQYTEQSYARSLIDVGLDIRNGNWSGYMDLYSEQDGKRQSLQQDLDPEDRAFLSAIGDNIGQALLTRFDTVPFSEDLVLYSLRDSLGYDSVFVFSTNPDQAKYPVAFSRVSLGAGDYIQDDFSANGRVYRWVAPDTLAGQIVHQGDHVPGILLVTPKQQQMLAGGIRYEWSERTWTALDAAFSNRDINTFSDLDSQDDVGSAFRLRAGHDFRLDSLSRLQLGMLVEQTAEDFTFIERYRPVEFERNWNLTSSDLLSDQLQTRIDVAYNRTAKKKLAYAMDRFATGNGYEGLNHSMAGRWENGPWSLRGTGSLLSTSGIVDSRFERHEADVSRAFGALRIGFKDLREENTFRDTTEVLGSSSYRFYQWESYIASVDTSTWRYRLFYRNRDDWRPTSDRLSATAHAEEYGVELSNATRAAHRITATASWRDLEIQRSDLISSTPEETFLGRLDYKARWLDGVILTSTFYEVGSGLERRKQFVYIQVPAGQGSYVWVDYNNDGVRDLDEFEIAQFQYEADFIRVFTPTDEFEKTFTNQVAQTLSIDMGRVWRKEQGLKRFLARLSDQASWRAERKTREEEGVTAFDPFVQNLQDTVLLSLNNSLRNSIFFNKINPKWSVDHSYTDIKNKQLLTNGFESRATSEHRVNARYTIQRKYTIRISFLLSEQSRDASYSTSRNYSITKQSTLPSLEWQPDRNLRLTLRGEWTQKENGIGEGERAEIIRSGFESRWSQVEKGSINVSVDYVKIDYAGQTNSSLAFEMLDGLKPGNNFTWNVFLQRNLAKNLELNLTYDGRKSEENKTIHAGGVQVRAFF